MENNIDGCIFDRCACKYLKKDWDRRQE